MIPAAAAWRGLALFYISTVLLGTLACPANSPHGEPDADVAGDSVVYVDQSAPSNGDGTAGRPFRTLSEAVGAARPGATIEVAVGRYVETVRIDRSVTIAGAGALTTLDGVGAEPALRVGVDGSVRLLDIQIDGVTAESSDLYLGGVLLTGEDHPALEAVSTAVVIEGGTVEGVFGAGIRVTGGSLEMRQAELRAHGGSSVVAIGSSRVLLSESAFGGQGGPAVLLDECDSRVLGVRIEDLTSLDDVDGQQAAGRPDGIEVRGGRIAIERAELARIGGSGIVLRGAEGEILESELAGVGEVAVAILADEAGAGSRARVADSELEEGFGVGIAVVDSELEASGNVFRRWQEQAIEVAGSSTVVIEENAFVDLRGGGVRVAGGGAGSVSRNRVVTAGGVCLEVADIGRDLEITGNTVRSCRGGGLVVRSSSGVTVSGNAVLGVRAEPGAEGESAGIILSGGSSVIVQGNESSANQGDGLLVVDGVSATVTGNRFEGNDGFGLRVRCADEGVEESIVISADNEYVDNGLGGESVCE